MIRFRLLAVGFAVIAATAGALPAAAREPVVTWQLAALGSISGDAYFTNLSATFRADHEPATRRPAQP